jgi:hypothetical protein
MSLNILDFRLRVIAELPKTKDLPVERLILDGLQDLCRETECYTEVSTDTSVSGTATYIMTPSTSTVQIIDFHEGKYNGVRIPKVSNKEMDLRDSKWETRSGTPSGFLYDGDTSIRFNVTPDTTGKAIQLEAVIEPANIGGVVPPRIERRHLEAVKAYVKWKVFEHPENFNPDMIGYWRRDYEDKRGRLKREVMHDGVVMEVTPRSFVTGRVQSPLSITVD